MLLYGHGKRAEQVYSVLSGVRCQLITRFTNVKFLANERMRRYSMREKQFGETLMKCEDCMQNLR